MKIGFFDSGLGGLTILKAVIKKLPQYNYLYFGDNARVPYGGRSPDLIYQFTTQALSFMFKKNCLLVVLACNTASSTSLRRIQREFLPRFYPKKKVLGVIKPAVEAINGQEKQIAVIGTQATINSNAFLKEIKKLWPKVKVIQKATPLLVPIIEEGETNWLGLNLILKKYLNQIKKTQPDKLILGCTHYGLIKDKIKKTISKKTLIIDEGNEVAKKLTTYLKNHSEIEKKLAKQGKREFYVTDLNDRYQKMAEKFFKIPLTLKLVHL